MKKEPKKPKSGKKVKKTPKSTKASFKRSNKAKSDKKKDKEEQHDGEAHLSGKSFVVIPIINISFHFPMKHITSRNGRGFPCLISTWQPQSTCHRPHHWFEAPTYGDYSLAGIPKNALPQEDKVHKGKHSYSVHKAGKIIEVLLRSQAYFVRGVEGAGKNGICVQHINSVWFSKCLKSL